MTTRGYDNEFSFDPICWVSRSVHATAFSTEPSSSTGALGRTPSGRNNLIDRANNNAHIGLGQDKDLKNDDSPSTTPTNSKGDNGESSKMDPNDPAVPIDEKDESSASVSTEGDLPYIPNVLVNNFTKSGDVRLLKACPSRINMTASPPEEFLRDGFRPRTLEWYDYRVQATIELGSFLGGAMGDAVVAAL